MGCLSDIDFTEAVLPRLRYKPYVALPCVALIDMNAPPPNGMGESN